MALSHKGKWEAAVKAFKDAEANHYKPTVSDIRALLFAAQGGGTPATWNAVHRLRALGALTAVDYEYALQVYAKTSHWSGAMKLLNHMEKQGLQWTGRACSFVLRTCGLAGRLSDAIQLIKQMLERGIIPGPVDFLQLLGACSRNLRKLRAAGDTRGGSAQAMELLQLMEQPGVEKPDFKHYSAAINVCGKAGDWTSAVHIFEQMQLQGVHANISCWTALLDALGRAKKVDQMLATYREMLASGQEPDTVAFGTLLAHAGAAGESGIAEDIRREMQRLKIAPNTWTYCALTNCYAVTGEPEKAEAVLAEMRQSTMTKPSAIAYNSVMKAYAVVGRLDEAVLIIDRMNADGVQPDSGTWQGLVHAAHRLGDVKKADELYGDALLSKTIDPYKPWRSTAIKLASDKVPTKGTIVSTHRVHRDMNRCHLCIVSAHLPMPQPYLQVHVDLRRNCSKTDVFLPTVLSGNGDIVRSSTIMSVNERQ